MSTSSAEIQSENWVPWRIRCQSKEEHAQILSALTNAVTAVVDDFEIYFYGRSSGALQMLFSQPGLVIERQALFCFKADTIKNPKAAAEAEKLLLCCPHVNAAVAHPTTGLVYIFVDQAFGHIRDPRMVVHVSVTINWPCFACMNGRPVSGEVVQYLGVYPEFGNPLELQNLKCLIGNAIPNLEIKVAHHPPHLQISFPSSPIAGESLSARVVEALQAKGYPCTSALPGRVELWHATDDKEINYSTVLRRTSAPSNSQNPTLAEMRLFQRNVETLLPGAKMQTTEHAFFMLGTSKTSVWHLPHKLKAGLLPLQDCISAVYINFPATHLIIAAEDVSKVMTQVPAILEHLEFAIGKIVPALPPFAPEELIEEASRAINYNSPHLPGTFPRAELVVTAVQPQGNPNVLALEEYIMLHHGMVNMLYDAASNTCFLRHSSKLKLPHVKSIFQNLDCEVQIIHGDQTEQYMALLQKLKNEAKARGKNLLGQEHYDESQAAEEDPVEEMEAATSQPDLMNDLEEKWVFYFDVADTGKGAQQAFENSLKEVGTFDTLQGFWRYWGAFDVDNLKEGLNLRLFKAGVQPSWEDPANKDGGKWMARGLPPKDRSRIWPTVALAMVQGMLKDDFDEVICGLVLSTKAGSDTIQVWCGNAFDPTTTGDKVTVGTILQKLVCTDQCQFFYQTHQGRQRTGPSLAQIEKAKASSLKKEEVRQWLTTINLEEYYDDFIADGYDDMRSIVALDEADLDDLGLKRGHKKRFLAARDKYLEEHQDSMPRVRGQDTHKWDDKGISGNWREGPMKVPPTRDTSTTMLERLKLASAARKDETHTMTIPKSMPPKRPDSIGSSIQAGVQPTSLPVPGASGLNPVQQLQYLTQLQQLQQAGMLGNLLGFGVPHSLSAVSPVAGVPAAVPGGFAAPFSSPTSYGADWTALLAGMAANMPGMSSLTPTPPPSMSSLPGSLASLSTASSSVPTSIPSSSPPSTNKASSFKLNPQAAAFKPSRPIPSPPPPPPESSSGDGSAADEDSEEDEKGGGWKESKAYREWKEIEWTTVEDDQLRELQDKMEERVALELTPRSQQTLKEMFPNPNPEWQELGQFLFLRNGPVAEKPLPDGMQVGEHKTLQLTGVAKNPRMWALRFDGVSSEVGPPHLVIYKATCSRQEESNYITTWQALSEDAVLHGVIKRVWRVRPPKRTNNNRKKQAMKRTTLQPGSNPEFLPMFSGTEGGMSMPFDTVTMTGGSTPTYYSSSPELMQLWSMLNAGKKNPNLL